MNLLAKFTETLKYWKSDIRDMRKYFAGVWERFKCVWPDLKDFLMFRFTAIMISFAVYAIFMFLFFIASGSYQEIPDFLKKVALLMVILLLCLDLLQNVFTQEVITSFWKSFLFVFGYEIISTDNEFTDETLLDGIRNIFDLIFWIVFAYSLIFFILLMIFNNSIFGFELAVTILRALIIAPFVVGFILVIKALFSNKKYH